jgi:Sulfotransferase family
MLMSFVDKLAEVKPRADVFNHTYISLRHSYVYLAVGKAANSTVKHHLFGLEYRGTRYKMRSVHDRQSAPLLSPFQLSDALLHQVFASEQFFRFALVRHPYTRLLSCYLDRIVPADSAPYRQLIAASGRQLGDAVSFDEFVRLVCSQRPFEQNNHWRLQVSELCMPHISYHFIGKQENFAVDMAVIWQRIAPGVPVPDFQKENKAPSVTSASSRLDEFYSEELRDMIREAYRDDFEAFGYSSQAALGTADA